MKTDQYGQIVNDEKTYKGIVDQIKTGNGVLIGWTDGRDTHLDILFTLRPIQSGNVQGGINGVSHLFVSIMRVGAFAFTANQDDIAPDYVQEKLSVDNLETKTALATLITEVKKLI